MQTAFLLYSPVKKLDHDITVGGAICIKTNSVSSYVGFATEDLAREFCVRWGMPHKQQFIRAAELGSQYPILDASIKSVVIFPDKDALDVYLAKPHDFPFELHMHALSSLSGAAL